MCTLSRVSQMTLTLSGPSQQFNFEHLLVLTLKRYCKNTEIAHRIRNLMERRVQI